MGQPLRERMANRRRSGLLAEIPVHFFIQLAEIDRQSLHHHCSTFPARENFLQRRRFTAYG